MIFALIIVTMMVLMFGAVAPVLMRETQQGSNYTEAALIAQAKMNQLRTTSFDNLGSSAALISSGIIDAVNSNGSYDFSTNSTDNLAAYFPNGTTGTITCTADTTTGSMSSGVYNVTVTISWPISGSSPGSFTLENKIINY